MFVFMKGVNHPPAPPHTCTPCPPTHLYPLQVTVKALMSAGYPLSCPPPFTHPLPHIYPHPTTHTHSPPQVKALMEKQKIDLYSWRPDENGGGGGSGLAPSRSTVVDAADFEGVRKLGNAGKGRGG